MSLATSIGREMNVFCEAEGQAHRLTFKSPILLYSDFKQLTTMQEEHYRADTLDITFDATEATLEETVKALCDKAEQMVRNGTVLLVLSDRNIAKNRLPVPAPMAVGAIQTRLLIRACAATPTSLWKPQAHVTRTTSRCCWASVRRQFIRTWPTKRWPAWWIRAPSTKITVP